MVADNKIFFVYCIISKGSGHQPDPFFMVTPIKNKTHTSLKILVILRIESGLLKLI